MILLNSCGNVAVQDHNENWINTNYVDAYFQVVNKTKFAISGPFLYLDTINSKSVWTNKIQTASCSGMNGCSSMIWMNTDNGYRSYKFLGLRFISGNDTTYGWARVSPTISVFNYAIERE